MGPSTEHYGANSTTPRTSFNDVASLISESLIRPISRGTTAEEDGKGNGRPLTFMEIDEALEYGRLKQRYDMRGKENMSDVEGDLLRVGGEGKEWAGICNEQDLLRCLESWDRTHEGAYLGLFLRNVKIFTVQLKVVKKLAEVLQIPWKFLSSVLLRQASRSSVYVRRNSDGEEELGT
ncbi:hypothetical protein BJ508DRAFT_79855 [Ascobolus immersus RN42]|uniref:Uncharacterized protein n=1 Tax=Ascobolus immersus RN42 TaxID=1160509 RepID=A0A3N4HGY9_ASCIM|nr:hypothetical protein BJ508DRAFT_79855 [Ascobolus immersus RN42]